MVVGGGGACDVVVVGTAVVVVDVVVIEVVEVVDADDVLGTGAAPSSELHPAAITTTAHTAATRTRDMPTAWPACPAEIDRAPFVNCRAPLSR